MLASRRRHCADSGSNVQEVRCGKVLRARNQSEQGGCRGGHTSYARIGPHRKLAGGGVQQLPQRQVAVLVLVKACGVGQAVMVKLSDPVRPPATAQHTRTCHSRRKTLKLQSHTRKHASSASSALRPKLRSFERGRGKAYCGQHRGGCTRGGCCAQDGVAQCVAPLSHAPVPFPLQHRLHSRQAKHAALGGGSRAHTRKQRASAGAKCAGALSSAHAAHL